MSLYQRRFYRDWMRSTGLYSFSVLVGHSDLFILCDRNVAGSVEEKLQRERNDLLRYLEEDPLFQATLVPHGVLAGAPPVVRMMSRASFLAGVGPMAAVAGAINDRIGELLHTLSSEFILENGGDLLVHSGWDRVVGIYAGERSPFRDRFGIVLNSGRLWGVATSSRVVGPSLNFGQADSVTVLANTSSVADAWATRLANDVRSIDDIERILDYSSRFPEVEGVIICMEDHLGIRGDIRLTGV